MTPHTVVLMAALAALLCLPCALFRVMRTESVVRRAWLRRARLELPRLRRLDSDLGSRPHACDRVDCVSCDVLAAGSSRGECAFLSGELRHCPCEREAATELGMPAFDQVMAELRRLDRERLGGLAQQSEEWGRAVVSAYDRWLRVACTYMSVPHHLACLTDAMDLEIERLRVEAELTAAGLPPIRRSDT